MFILPGHVFEMIKKLENNRQFIKSRRDKRKDFINRFDEIDRTSGKHPHDFHGSKKMYEELRAERQKNITTKQIIATILTIVIVLTCIASLYLFFRYHLL